ncbi:hypothetical protein EDD35_1207 [Amycolatopsis thermoflava]|uniref:Uncharacterized protein n=1 Tax=Amycolatopsis thermoflava TaxID=84480 RepID=A0A3N2GQM3_9PSEU|nr:hypothetical protein EDD35_1207 [Amycolatopsis thermoflava]
MFGRFLTDPGEIEALTTLAIGRHCEHLLRS